LTPIQIPWQMAISFMTKYAFNNHVQPLYNCINATNHIFRSTNGTLLSVKMGDDSDIYRIDLIEGTVAFLHRGNLFVTGHAMVNDNIWHDAQVQKRYYDLSPNTSLPNASSPTVHTLVITIYC